MGDCVLRLAPDRDIYLIWATDIGCPITVGDRDWVHRFMTGRPRDFDDPDQALARADATGTSDTTIGYGRWDQEPPHDPWTPADGWYHVPHELLFEYVADLLEDEEDEAAELLVACMDHVQKERHTWTARPHPAA